MGDFNSLNYDGVNYMEQPDKLKNIYAHFRFWGEDPSQRGVYLKSRSGMQTEQDQPLTAYAYNIKVSESGFEQYVDDMGALIVDFYNASNGYTIGTSKVIVNLYLKRCKKEGDMNPLIELRGTYPITLTGDLNKKIGEF